MRKKYKYAVIGMLVAGAGWLATAYVRSLDLVVLNPKGAIGHEERNLIMFATYLSLVVVVPVFVMLFVIAWRYRASNKKATYSPDLDGNRLFETIWWLIPAILILILSVVTWRSSHKLDPYKALAADTKPLTVQVVALDWKWLFIYPEQNIATVNMLEIPTNTPINLHITADAPMNSFWIPQLAGQVYAMPGMSTQLHITADTPGDYKGASANISGKGFAGMTFTARAVASGDFDRWVEATRHAAKQLSNSEYQLLAKPSENNKPTGYSAIQHDLYDTILMKYMMPTGGHEHDHDHSSPHGSTLMQGMGM